MPKSDRDEMVFVWNDEDLMEAWLMTPNDGVLSPLDHAVAAELNRRAAGGERTIGAPRERFWRYW